MNATNITAILFAAATAVASLLAAPNVQASPAYANPVSLQLYLLNTYGKTLPQMTASMPRTPLVFVKPQLKCTFAGTPYLQAKGPAVLHCP